MSMEDLIHAIYIGAVATEISEHETAEYLKEARKANRRNDISGMMLYVEGCLLLLLEGTERNVDAAFHEIVASRPGLRCLFREPIAEREFADWIMGFEAVASEEAARLLGEPVDFSSGAAQIEPRSALTLLSIIGRRRWQSDRSGMFRAIRGTKRTAAR
jgi:hypothetical protein